MVDMTDLSKNYIGDDHGHKVHTLDTEVLKVNGVAVKNPVLTGEVTTAGGAAAEEITVAGALTTDLLLVTLKDDGTNDVTILTATISAANTLTITFSANPGADAIVSYMVLR